MNKLFALTLGILTAIGGFVDIGDLVTSAVVGSRFGLNLAWVLIVGVIGICLFAEMSGRVAAVSGRATFDLIRERLGPRVGLVNLLGSTAVTALTYVAEIGGVALAIQLAADISIYLLIPVIGALVWIVLWRVKFKLIENVFGISGLCLVVFGVAVAMLNPDWHEMGTQILQPTLPETETWATYLFYAVALFGAALTPYEVFFFSSGGVEEKWKPRDLADMRLNVFIGFPLGGLLSLSIAACASLVLLPAGIQVDSLGQVVLPVVVSLGKIGLIVALIGMFSATFGAACETGLSIGYSISQFFGWQWGKFVPPIKAARFHMIILVSTIAAIGILLTTVDPVMVTEYSVVFSAIALPLTYFPILLVCNDRRYMGKYVNGRLCNVLGTIYLVVIVAAALAAIPLMIITRVGQ